MTEEQVKMIRQCATCQGEGAIDAPHCGECGQSIEPSDPWWDTVEEILPCGHPAEALVEKAICPECGGDGRYSQWVSISEWQTLRRRKIMTGIILLIALLLPVTAVVLAIADAYPGYVCGRWWYGIIFIVMIVNQKKNWLK